MDGKGRFDIIFTKLDELTSIDPSIASLRKESDQISVALAKGEELEELRRFACQIAQPDQATYTIA